MRVRVPPPVLARSRRHAPWALALVPAVVLAALCAAVSDWAVMTDELLYERLALSFVDGAFFPTVHGERVDVYAVLYPFLLMPAFALVDLPEAIRVAHGFNGVLFASTVVPTYLLARELALPRFSVIAAAIFSVAIPWTVIGGFVMTEAAAYPAAVWALLAVQRALVVASRRRDVIAFGAIGVATLARPQLAGLGIAFVASVLVLEARFGRWRDHVVALLVGAVALPVAVLGGGGLLGSYGATLEEGAVISVDGLHSALVHLNVTAVALGIVPLLLGGGWALAALVRAPAERGRLAFAALVVATTTVLAVETGSVVVRFGIGIEVKDRYFFYVAPLLFLATACALDDPRPRIAGVLATSAIFVGTVGLAEFEPVFGVNVDSPASATNELLTDVGDAVGLSAAELIAVAGGALAVALVGALRRRSRGALSTVVLAAVLGLVAAESVYTWDRLFDSTGVSGRLRTSATPAELSWIDAAIDEGSVVGMLTHTSPAGWYPSAVKWWDVEFWNARVGREYLIDGTFTYTPDAFPHESMRIDPETGLVAADAPDYLVRSVLDSRFRPAGVAAVAAGDLEVVDLEVPLRAAWLTLGLDPDGWTRSGERAFLRVFPPEGSVTVTMTLSAPAADGPVRVAVGPSGAELAPNEARELVVEACVPAGGYAELEVSASELTTIPAIETNPPNASYRNVGVRVTDVSAVATGAPCQT